ncbi:hypothetical protein PHET_12417, partial [Paragonimus heterotremus]
ARIVPFFYTPRGVCYSLLWPLRDLERDEAITVDYIEHVNDPYLRQFYLIPWQPEDFSGLPIEHRFILSETFFQVSLIMFCVMFCLRTVFASIILSLGF